LPGGPHPRYFEGMGRLKEESGARILILEAETLVGRRESCMLSIGDGCVSSVHASIRWSESRWIVRDLNSTNGTWLNGELLHADADKALALGDRLTFGAAPNHWIVEDVTSPAPMVIAASDGRVHIMEDGVLAVPGKSGDFASIFRSKAGAWQLEMRDATTSIGNDETFSFDGTTWRFSCSADSQSTVPVGAPRLIDDCDLILAVSADEEHVEVTADCAFQRLSLGTQSGYYLLLTLARLRRTDEQSGITAEDAGWRHREELIRMLRCTETQLNVWICRIRAKFETMGFLDYASIVERREGTGRLRIGASRLSLVVA
jgi:hypothetical protein